MAQRYCGSPGCKEGPDGHPAELTGRQRLYCSKKCGNREYQRRKRGSKPDLGERETARRGDVYEDIIDNGYVYRILNGSLSMSAVADILEVSEDAVRRAVRAYEIDAKIAKKADDWVMSDTHIRMLGPMDAPVDPDEFEKFLDDMVAAFIEFRDEFFRLATDEPFITSHFHQAWIRETLRTIYMGGQNMILSPPRHGKSELLTQFCVWLICRNPNIRIAWIGGNKEIAEDMCGVVREHLADNEPLQEAFLPPGESFKPKSRTSGQWQRARFRVANRTVTGVKASTMVAVGRGGKILSRDMDFIICDDIEDHDSTLVQSSRHSTRSWFETQLYSRKEDHTGLVVIGSRQHADDLYNHLMDNDDWNVIVNQAHDDLCTLDPDDLDIHVDCMLFPEIRSYKWLMQKQRSANSLGLPELYEMVYLNRPRPEGGMVFSEEAIDASYNPARGLGVPPRNEGDLPMRLVAGLDPAATGYQASFLWGWDPSSRRKYMLDLENTLGGGIVPAYEQIVRWFDMYQVRHWVIEDNLYHGAILDDPRIVEFARANDIHIEGHQTQSNKHDPFFGVTSLARDFEVGAIDLPTGSEEARAKVLIYKQQLLSFDSDATAKTRRRAKSDVLMSSWFPVRAIRRWEKEVLATMSVERTEFDGWESLFDVSGETPW